MVKSLLLLQPREKNTWPTLKKVDGHDQFETVVNKWKNISKVVMKVGCSEHMKNSLTCKDKWHTITSDFKKIYDFMHYNNMCPCMSSDFNRF
jgi:hypothetical protein